MEHTGDVTAATAYLGSTAALRAENARLRAELGRARAALLARHDKPLAEPPPEFTLAYESPLQRRFTAVRLPGGQLIVLDRDRVGERSAAEVWHDITKLP